MWPVSDENFVLENFTRKSLPSYVVFQCDSSMEEADQNLAERFEFDNQNKTMSMAIFASSGQKCIQNEKK